jgi:hypothetical protein
MRNLYINVPVGGVITRLPFATQVDELALEVFVRTSLWKLSSVKCVATDQWRRIHGSVNVVDSKLITKRVWMQYPTYRKLNPWGVVAEGLSNHDIEYYKLHVIPRVSVQ